MRFHLPFSALVLIQYPNVPTYSLLLWVIFRLLRKIKRKVNFFSLKLIKLSYSKYGIKRSKYTCLKEVRLNNIGLGNLDIKLKWFTLNTKFSPLLWLSLSRPIIGDKSSYSTQEVYLDLGG